MTNAVLKGAGINEESKPPSETNVDLGESLDLGDKSQAEVSIDAAADAFVESDETLNTEIEK